MNSFITYCSINKYHDLYKRTTGTVAKFLNPCIGYIISGTVDFLYKGKTISAKEGDLIYIAPETKYYSLWTGKPDIILYSITYKLKNIADYMDYRFQIVQNFPKCLFDDVYNSYKKAESDFIVLGHMNMLLSQIYTTLLPGAYNSKYKKIEPSVEYIEKNFNLQISIKQLSNLCGYSEAHFYSLFKEIMGVSPISYKNNIAIQHALKALSESNSTIEEISTFLGFSSSNYFRHVFYKNIGATPRSVRSCCGVKNLSISKKADNKKTNYQNDAKTGI